MYNLKRLPHKIDTRINAVKLYRAGVRIKEVCDKYNVSKAALMRWNSIYDGTKKSLEDKSCIANTRTYSAELRLNSVLLYRSGKFTLKELANKYGFSVGSLIRWNKIFDGTKESLMDK